MPLRSRLVASLAGMIRKALQGMLPPDHTAKTGELNRRVPGATYDFGCSPETKANISKTLEHGGKYPRMKDPGS